MQKIRIGTRGSQLALWQAEYIAGQLKKNGLDPEIVIIDTKGDKILDVSISKIGGKGIFTEELEEKLSSGQIDIAVHSAKDLQSTLAKGFEVIAFTKREKVNDVLVSLRKEATLNDHLVVGTSSTRRVATLKYHFPHIKVVDMRGNLQTRIRKMEEGTCDALILAYAGVHRMNYDHLIAGELPEGIFTPAVGQGSLAIEAYSHMASEVKNKIRVAVNDSETEQLILGERAFLRVLEGGCSIPAFALSKKIDSSTLEISAGLYRLDGSEVIKKTKRGLLAESEDIGKSLAMAVLEDGGAQVLKEIKSELNK